MPTYDYWSQAKQSGNPSAQDENIRVSGQWETPADDAYLYLDELNEDGIVYATAKAGRGAMVRGRFYVPSGSYSPRYGLVMNFHQESKAEAAERLGKELDEVSGTDYGFNCLYALHENNTFAVYQVIDSVEHLLYSAQVSTPPTDQWFTMQAEFHDGFIRIMTKPDTTSSWTTQLSYTYFSTNSPWHADEAGRGGFYVKNITPNAMTSGFSSMDNLIPMESNAAFTTPTTVIVDDEIITISGKSSNTPNPSTYGVMNGTTWEDKGQPHDNVLWTDRDGYEIYVRGLGAVTNPDQYNGYALVILDANLEPTSTCYEIVGYDYSAPRQWVPTGTYVEPDKWTDHVGDLSHGYWAAADRQRFIVSTFPSGLTSDSLEPVGLASVVVRPSLTIDKRGQNGTNITSHSSARVNFYIVLSVQCEKFEYYSTDLDLSLEWMMAELARKAGVRDLTFEKVGSTTVTNTHTGWNIPTDYANNHHQRDGSFVMRFKIVSGTEPGLAMKKSDGSFDVVTSTTSYLRRYTATAAGTTTLREQIPIPSPRAGWITMSFYDNYVGVWINDRLAVVFSDVGSDDAFLVSNGNATFTVDWPALDQRVDNFIIEMGTRGGDLLSRLIGQKRIFVKDDQTGGLTAFRTRTTISTHTPITMAVLNGNITSDAELITRIRLEGLEAVEEVDYEALRLYGNIFQIANAEELELLNQFTAEAQAILNDAVLSYQQTTLIGAADPRVEPEDILPVTLPDSTRDIIVTSVTFRMEQDAGAAVFDMEVSARDV